MATSTAASGTTTPNEDAKRPFATLAQVTIASHANYAEAETAVDRLSDQGFPVHHLTIVGTGLRSVETIEARMTVWDATLIGAVAGMLLGGLLALVAGGIVSELNSTEAFLSSLGACTLFGAVTGALVHTVASDGRRDFVTVRRTEADRYDLQVDEAMASEATRLLDAAPAGR